GFGKSAACLRAPSAMDTRSASAFNEARATRALSIASSRLSGACARHRNPNKVTAINKIACLFTNILPNRQSPNFENERSAPAGCRVGAHECAVFEGRLGGRGSRDGPVDSRRVMPALFHYLERLDGHRRNESYSRSALRQIPGNARGQD